MRRTRRLLVEALETRNVMAAFGVPWHDPGHLSLSFVPDGTVVGDQTSELFAALNGQPAAGDWQRVILAAFQAWAEQANLNFAWRPDGGQPLGAAGFVQGDLRFGDIRVGAHAMSDSALAIAVPPDPALAGTLTGDVLLNSLYAFDGDPYSLLAVMLHEAGHALGIGNSDNPDAVMHSTYSTSRTTLSPEDIGRIQALYGQRAADEYEGPLGNNTRGRASSFQQPQGYKGETPLVAFGDLTRRGDVDFFKVTSPPDGNDDQFDRALTIRLQTAGRSLLAPKVTVLDQSGRVLARRTSSSYVGNTLQLQLQGLSAQQQYFIRVEGARADVFGVGSYGLSVRFDKTSSTADEVINRLLGGPFEQLGPDAIDAFFRTSGDLLLNEDQFTNETPASATPLTPQGGYATATRFEGIASLGSKEDVDFYRLTAPFGNLPVLTATVWTTSDKGFEPNVAIYNSQGQAAPFSVLSQAGGTSTVQITNAAAGQTYFLRVSLSPSANEDKGNYHVSANFGTIAANIIELANETLSKTDAFDTARLYIAEPQLMQFVLAAGNEDPGAKIHLRVTGPAGTVVDFTALAGETVTSGGVLLRPGPYDVRLDIDNPNGPAMRYRLRGARLSDPIGPVVTDPTLDPGYELPPPDPNDPELDPGAPPQPPYVYPDLPVPYDPTTLPGYYDTSDPWPWGTPPPGLLTEHEWLLLGYDPFLYVPIE